jgi:malate/lactate dehydrogenase
MGPEGVKEIVEFDLTPGEQEALKVSAEVIREQIKRGEAWLRKVNP